MPSSSSKYFFFHHNSCQETLFLFHRKAPLRAAPRVALGSLFLADEVLVAHLSEAAHHADKLTEVHSVVLVCIQVLEDAIYCCLVIGFLQVRKMSAKM